MFTDDSFQKKGFDAETFEAKGGFDRNCKVCKGTGWMPKKGDPKDAKTAKLLGVSIDELTMQPCNAGGKDMGCFNAETFEATDGGKRMKCRGCSQWEFVRGVAMNNFLQDDNGKWRCYNCLYDKPKHKVVVIGRGKHKPFVSEAETFSTESVDKEALINSEVDVKMNELFEFVQNHVDAEDGAGGDLYDPNGLDEIENAVSDYFVGYWDFESRHNSNNPRYQNAETFEADYEDDEKHFRISRKNDGETIAIIDVEIDGEYSNINDALDAICDEKNRNVEQIDFTTFFGAESFSAEKFPNKCFICLRDAKNQRGFMEVQSEPSLTDKEGNIWLCNHHNNVLDFGLFAKGDILSWTHPNGTKYRQGRLLKDAETFNADSTPRFIPVEVMPYDDWWVKRFGRKYNPQDLGNAYNMSYVVLVRDIVIAEFDTQKEAENHANTAKVAISVLGGVTPSKADHPLALKEMDGYKDKGIRGGMNRAETFAGEYEELITTCPYCEGKKIDDHGKYELVGCFKRYLEDSTPHPDAKENQIVRDRYYRGLLGNAETFEAPIMPFNRSGRPCPSCRSWSQSFIGGVCSRCASKDRKKAETFEATKGIDTFAEPFEEIGISKPYARLGVIAAGITALAFGVNKIRK